MRKSIIISLGIILTICIVTAGVFIYIKFPNDNGYEITSNSDFSRYMFTGKGTSDNPYVLSGEYFSNSRRIDVSGTSKYFTILNCFFEGCPRDGISLVKVGEGTIKIVNCTFEGCEIGIFANYADGIMVNNCTFLQNDIAIGSLDSERLNISNNIVQDNKFGFEIHDGSGSTYDSNSFYNSIYFGLMIVGNHVQIYHLLNNVFENDSITFSNNAFVESYAAEYCTIENNTFDGKLSCFYKNQNLLTISEEYSIIWLYNCQSVTIINQNMSRVYQGILANKCSNLLIKDSIFSEVHDSIAIYDSSNAILDNITIQGYFQKNLFSSSVGIYCESVDVFSINNSRIDTLKTGISIDSSGNQIDVLNTIFTGCNSSLVFEGISKTAAGYSENIFISDCTFNEGEVGISLLYCSEINVLNNVFINQTSIVFQFSNSQFISIIYNYIDLRAGAQETEFTDCDSLLYENNTIVT